MHVGRSYKLTDFALWSRRSVVYMVVVSLIAIAAYRMPGMVGFSVPWTVILVLGTTVSLVSGFKNSQVLSRSGEALQVFAQLSASSRVWASLCRDFTEPAIAKALIYRHLAWLTALRFALRRPMPWESMGRKANAEYRRRYHIQEDTGSLRTELALFLADETEPVLQAPHPELRLLDLQMSHINRLLKDSAVPPQIYGELLKLIRDLHDQQARCDRIKNSPYPRQYAIVSAMFVMIFCTLLPFGVVSIFAEMSRLGGIMGTAAPRSGSPSRSVPSWAGCTWPSIRSGKARPIHSRATPTTFRSRKSAGTSRSKCARPSENKTSPPRFCPSTALLRRASSEKVAPAFREKLAITKDYSHLGTSTRA